MEKVDIDKALERIGYGPTHLLILIASGMMLVYMMTETLGTALLMVARECDKTLSNNYRFLLTSATFIGMVFGGSYCGYLADVYGRRSVMIRCASYSICCSIIAALVPLFEITIVFRFLCGFFLSGLGVNTTYLSEFIKIEVRSKIINLMSYFSAFGLIYVAYMFYLLLPTNFNVVVFGYNFETWRFMKLILNLPGILGVILLYFMPPSPKFLLTQKGIDEAYSVLDKLCRQANRGKCLEDLNIKIITPNMNDSPKREEKSFFISIRNEIVQLFAIPHVKILLPTSAVMFGMFFVGNGWALWFPTLRKGSSNITNLTVCDFIYVANPLLSFHSANTRECFVENHTYVEGFLIGFGALIWFITISLELLYLSRASILISNLVISAFAGFLLNFLKNSTGILITFLTFIIIPHTSVFLMSTALIDGMPIGLTGKANVMAFVFGRAGSPTACFLISKFIEDYCNTFLNITVIFLLLLSGLIIYITKQLEKKET